MRHLDKTGYAKTATVAELTENKAKSIVCSAFTVWVHTEQVQSFLFGRSRILSQLSEPRINILGILLFLSPVLYFYLPLLKGFNYNQQMGIWTFFLCHKAWKYITASEGCWLKTKSPVFNGVFIRLVESFSACLYLSLQMHWCIKSHIHGKKTHPPTDALEHVHKRSHAL